MDDSQLTRFTALWASAQPSVFVYISASIANFSDAEDVLQKVATAAVHKFGEYEQERPFVAWALGIARFEILRYLRDHASDKHEFIADALDQVSDAFASISPELDSRRQALAQCLKGVTGRSRNVLDKRFGDGLKTGAIAKALGLSAGNVSVILNRTYRKLRECIDAKIASEGA